MNPFVLMLAFGAFLLIAGKGGIDMVREARGLRNNNPGNIKRNATRWQGLAPEQSDPVFFTFASAHYGIRAMARILRNYRRLHNITTLRGVMRRYAPTNENPTDAYIDAVARWSGIVPDEAINLDDEATLARIVPAMIRFENGSNPYSIGVIRHAVEASA